MTFSHLLSARLSDNSGVPTKQIRSSVVFQQRSGQILSRFLLSALAPLVLGGAIALPAVLIPEVAQAQEIFDFNRILREGDRGRDVLVLQEELVRRGFLSIDIPRNAREGFFGPETFTAVRAFQNSEQGLIRDGVAGQQTIRRLFGQGLVPTQAYSIAILQAQLSELGYYRNGLDGRFGFATQQALADLRDETFLEVDVDGSDRTLERTFETVGEYYNGQRERRDLPHRSVLEARVERAIPESRLLAFGPIGSDRNSGGGSGGGPERITAQGAPYVVIVPLGDNPQRFFDVRRSFPGSIRVADRRGDYVQVGAFGDRGNAEALVNDLQRAGFSSARVIFD